VNNFIAWVFIVVVAGLIIKSLLWVGIQIEKSRQRDRTDIVAAGNITAARRRGIEQLHGGAIQLNGGYFDGSIVPSPPTNARHDNVLRVIRSDQGMALAWISLDKAVNLESFTDVTAVADFTVIEGKTHLLKEVLAR